MKTIGIYGVSGQSGKAFLSDLLAMPIHVYGYARPTDHGKAAISAINDQKGLLVERPANNVEPNSRFVELGSNRVGHDLEQLVDTSDVIIFSHPSVYHEETVREMKDFLLRQRRRVPIVLSPSRTLGVPYIWEILGEGYPVVSFGTCPYACKTYAPGSVFIKRRKKAWLASLEGETPVWTTRLLSQLFPQVVMTDVPATTSLGNIGAVFHPTAYLLNLGDIQAAAAKGEIYSFYMQGIAHNPAVGPVVEDVDQARLRIAEAVGCSVFGLKESPREEEWAHIMGRVAQLDQMKSTDVRILRKLRGEYLRPIHDAVVSAQHWLAYTYGVQRIVGESLPSAIGRTPNYQANSVPQARYADEDVPAGLVPLEALAQRLGTDLGPMGQVIDLYDKVSSKDSRKEGRNLERFTTEFLTSYLLGRLSQEKCRCLSVAS